MGELIEQVISGGPGEVAYAALPECVRTIGDNPELAAACRWELYRMSDRIRSRLVENGIREGITLHKWATFERVAAGAFCPKPQDFARWLASVLAGEWWSGEIRQAVLDVIPGYTRDTAKHTQRIRDAVAAIVTVASYYAA